MNEIEFSLNNIRFELSFKSFYELRSILSFYQENNIYKINIPCKNTIKKDFLLKSIELSREEFPDIDIIPHFSILHEFRRNRLNTQSSFVEFLQIVKYLGCREVLLVSGSQKRSTLDSVTALNFIKENHIFSSGDFSIAVAFNPYLPSLMFEQELIRLEKKIKSGIVSSIWLQFGSEYALLESRIEILNNIIFSIIKNSPKQSNIKLFGSILIPSKQFLARFKYRPWKGVYCSNEFLGSEDFAINRVKELLKTYRHNNICPVIETDTSTEEKLSTLKNIIHNL